MHFGVSLTDGKMFRELTDPDPDPDLSLPGPGSSFSDPWQLYHQTRSKCFPSFTCRWCHLTWTWRQKPLLSIFQPRAKTNFYTHYHLSVFYIKGKGMMETYFLCGKDDFSRPLPDVSLAQSLEAPDCK